MPIVDIADIHESIKTAIIARLKSLDLGGLEQRVYNQLFFADPLISYPAIAVLIQNDPEGPLPGDTLNTEWMYPVTIWLIWRAAKWDQKMEPTILAARKTVIDSFHQQNLSDVPYSYGSTVQPLPALQAFAADDKSDYQFVGSGLVVKTGTFQPRK